MRRRVLRALVLAAGACLALAGAAAGFVYWQAQAVVDEFQAGPKRQVVESARRELDVDPRRPAETGPERPTKARTILLVGSDHRYGETKRHSDSILLVRLDPGAGRGAVLSVPRDLYVRIPGHGHDRVNEAYARGGPALLIRTLREKLGIRINHFFDIDFGGFERVVNAMDGVYVPIGQRYFNRNVGTAATNFADIDLRPGYQRLSGRQALAFVRFRHTDSDRYRAARQQLFLLATARQALGTRAYDVARVRRLLRALARATTSDVDGVGELWDLVAAARAAAEGQVRRYTLPTRDLRLYGADYVAAGDRRVRRTVRAWLGLRASQPAARAPRQQAQRRPPAPVRLRPDPSGARLLAATGQWVPCRPAALPHGFSWPEADAARGYRLAGRPAAALYATRGSGRSILWTWTTWQDPPFLDAPTRRVTRGGRTYELTIVSGRVHEVAWRIGEWRIWITNTLRDELSGRALLELADTCRRVGV